MFGGRAQTVQVPVAATVRHLAGVLLVPILLGMAIRAAAPVVAGRAGRWVSRFAVLLLVMLPRGPGDLRTRQPAGGIGAVRAGGDAACLRGDRRRVCAWPAGAALDPGRADREPRGGFQNAALAILIALLGAEVAAGRDSGRHLWSSYVRTGARGRRRRPAAPARSGVVGRGRRAPERPVIHRICIFGAGSIGCYVGGRLAAGGAPVTLIGRERIGSEIAHHGLHVTDWQGATLDVSPDGLRFATTAEAAADAALVLVTGQVGGHELPRGSPWRACCGTKPLSSAFRTGSATRSNLKGHLIPPGSAAGMVPFNVVNRGRGAFHQGSQGALEVERHAALAGFEPSFVAAGLPLVQHSDLRPVQWAKLLLNLNNSINALSGLPLKEQLSQRDYRRCVSLAQQDVHAAPDAVGGVRRRHVRVPGWRRRRRRSDR